MTASPLPVLATMAAIIGLGFLGYLLFERTRITDVLLLIAFGVLVGPVLGVFNVDGFKAATPVVGALALLVIMFDGGLSLRLRDLLSSLARSTVLAVVGFALTVGAVAAAGHYWIGLDWMRAALLGTIIGGTSSVVVMPIVRRTSASEETRVLLSLESALTDIFCVLGAVTIVSLLTTGAASFGSAEASSSAKSLAAQFSIAIVLGLIVGFAWLRLLKTLQRRKYAYMITLAAILGLHVGTETLGGSGAMSVLVFGVVLGNGYIITRKFEFEGLEFTTEQRRFQEEITFLVRVFFFVYLGVILDPAIILDPRFLVDGLILVGAIVAARAIAIFLATWGDEGTAGDRILSICLLPRGLAAAVLAGLPALSGITGTANFVAYAFVVVVATNVITTGAVTVHEFLVERRAIRDVPTVGGGGGVTPTRRA